MSFTFRSDVKVILVREKPEWKVCIGNFGVKKTKKKSKIIVVM